MGTRHLIAVHSDGEYKVAQYGQWDGYPVGQGVGVLNFLKDPDNISKLKENLKRVRFIDFEKDKEFLDEYDKNCPRSYGDPETRTPEQIHWFESYTTRDLGAQILGNIANSTDSEILLQNGISFAADSLFCEWAYVVDLDKNTLEVYKGFNKTELDESERFYGYTNEEVMGSEKYTPVRHIKTYSLDDLPYPDVFENDLDPREDEDEE